jgi:hypothetical protein
MKTLLTILIFTFFSTVVSSLESIDTETATVYLIRDTKSMGALRSFNVFVDNEPVCQLKNHHYIKTNLGIGAHKFSVQMTGSKAKSAVDHFELELEKDKTYYLKVETPGSVMGSSSFIEITNHTAEKMIPKLDEQQDCK